VLAVLFLLSLPAVTPRLYSSDEIQYFSYLRSLWFDRDLSFENEYQYFYERGIARAEGFHETFLERTTPTGRRINFGTMGCAVLWAPFYAVGDVIARASGAPVDGFSRPYVAAVAYGSAAYAFLAILLAMASARRLGLDAFVAGLVMLAGTPLLFYGYIAPPYSHACSAFAVALFIYIWLRVREHWSIGGLAALGACAALMTMVREQDAFVVLPVAGDFALSFVNAKWQMANAKRQMPKAKDERTNAKDEMPKAKFVVAALVGMVTFGLVYSPQAVAYLRLNGHVGPHSSVGAKMNWMAPHALQVLFSPEHGFFVWTPLALLAIFGLVASAFRRKIHDGRRIFLLFLLMIALQVYVSGSVESWTVAGAFGQRRFVALTAILVIGYAALQRACAGSNARRATLAAVTILGVYWNLALIAEFSIGLMDRQKLEPRRNAYDAFVTIPAEAPSLAYRFLFDRASFYQGARRRAAGDTGGPR
jgi:hypothetical protein